MKYVKIFVLILATLSIAFYHSIEASSCLGKKKWRSTLYDAREWAHKLPPKIQKVGAELSLEKKQLEIKHYLTEELKAQASDNELKRISRHMKRMPVVLNECILSYLRDWETRNHQFLSRKPRDMIFPYFKSSDYEMAYIVSELREKNKLNAQNKYCVIL